MIDTASALISQNDSSPPEKNTPINLTETENTIQQDDYSSSINYPSFPSAKIASSPSKSKPATAFSTKTNPNTNTNTKPQSILQSSQTPSSLVNHDPYLSGPELRLLIYYWDSKNWTLDSLSWATSAELNALTSLTIMKSPPTTTKTANSATKPTNLAILKSALLDRVKSIMALKSRRSGYRDPKDDKTVKSLSIWVHAIIYLTSSALTSPKTGAIHQQSQDVTETLVLFLGYILSTPLLTQIMESSAFEMLVKEKSLDSILSVFVSKSNLDSLFEIVKGESLLFLLCNLIGLFQYAQKSGSCSVDPALFSKACSVLLEECGRFVSLKATSMSRFHPVFNVSFKFIIYPNLMVLTQNYMN
jgi:hypothetical protein